MPSSTVAKHHAEWLSLIEISGPFLGLTALNRVFPNELDIVEPQQADDLRSVYQEWADDVGNPAIHRLWILYVLKTLLGWDDRVLAEGQAIPEPLKYVAEEHGETVRPTFLLHEPGHPDKTRALIQVYPAQQGLERNVPSVYWAASPAMRMLSLLHFTGITLGLITNGEQWMLVNAPAGGTAGYISWYAELWNEERLTLRAFTSLLCARRFFGVADEDTLEAMLRESADDAHEVTDQLGLQVRHAVAILVRRLDRVDQELDGALLKDVSEARLYEATLTVMMRLVFLFSAEERGLFLLGDPIYDQNYAVSTLRAQLHEAADRSGEEVLGFRSDAWSRLLATFRMVFAGAPHEDMKLPAYGGSLFDPDRFSFLEGRPAGSRWDRTRANPPAVDNRTVLHLLDALQVLQTRGELRRLSFRALDIEQIGHVYEGLLDHEARRADEPILGFGGGVEPEIALSELEAASNVVKFLKEATGRSSESSIKRALSASPDGERVRRLAAACVDEKLFDRVVPYLNLLRDDEFGYPLVIHPGSVYVTAGTERRASGTHYTPKALTEPIVEHTLEPIIYHGPAEGLPRAQWQLKSARELLAIKVCDMAMGSGAFLVQVCRYLAARLVEAWTSALAAENDPVPRLTVEGEQSAHVPDEILIPDDPNERTITAQRLIADRCLYGVDKNPLAVEMAKLSLWLVTLAKGRPFTFLDHALKCGDSLLGVSLQQLKAWALDAKSTDMALFRYQLHERIEDMVKLRQQLESFTVNDVKQQHEKERLFGEGEMRVHDLRIAGNLLVASYLVEGLNEAKRDDLRLRLLQVAMSGDSVTDADRELLTSVLERHNPFHWELEFPEVFTAGGFHAFVGNPPFQGGSLITGALGVPYRDYLVRYLADGQRGNADLCAYFFLRAYGFLRTKGTFGLIATNTIAQGDTREVGLVQLAQKEAVIFAAQKDVYWPGVAAVAIDVIHAFKGKYRGERCLNDLPVAFISPLLDDIAVSGRYLPERLRSNEGKSFNGSKLDAIGFVLMPEEAQTLIDKDGSNSEVLFPYLNGEDVNSRPDQTPSRWVINFFDWELEQAEQYSDCIAIVRERVYPQRMQQNDLGGRRYWWRYLRTRPELHAAIATMQRVLIISETTKYCTFSFYETGIVFSHMVKVMALEQAMYFCVLASTIHEIWARQFSSTLETRLKYSPTDVFETFPFPPDESLGKLETIGEQYHEFRRQIMLSRQEGLTDTYNRFHDPNERSADSVQLRALHAEMDHAVAAAYGWSDFDVKYDFYETPQGVRYTMPDEWRREVLKRLLTLNFQRAAEEQAILAGTVKVKKKGKKSAQEEVSAPAAPEGEPFDPNAPPPEQRELWDDGSPKQSRLL